MGLKTFYTENKRTIAVIAAIVLPLVVLALIVVLKKWYDKTRYNFENTEIPEIPVSTSGTNTSNKGGKNNPGNIRTSTIKWIGKITNAGDVFESFDTVDHGIRAMYLNLMSYRKRGDNTINKIISKWAPASENNTAAYINSVSKALGKDKDTVLDIEDYPAVIAAMSKIEGNTLVAVLQVQNVVSNIA